MPRNWADQSWTAQSGYHDRWLADTQICWQALLQIQSGTGLGHHRGAALTWSNTALLQPDHSTAQRAVGYVTSRLSYDGALRNATIATIV